MAAPYLVTRGRWGYRMGDGKLHDSLWRDGLNDAFWGAAFWLAHEDSLRFSAPRNCKTAGPSVRNSVSRPRRRPAISSR